MQNCNYNFHTTYDTISDQLIQQHVNTTVGSFVTACYIPSPRNDQVSKYWR